MGSGSSVPAFQLTTEEAAGVDAFVAAGVAEVPSLARRVEELQAGAQESERLIEGVAQEQLQEEVRSLRRRVEELQEEVAQLKEEAGAEEAERLLDEAQVQLPEAAVETALAQVAGRRVEELQAGSHDSEKLQEEVRSLRQAEAAAARRIEELESRLREVCSLHQAETAATQRIQELDSYLREEAKGVEQVLGSAGGGTSSSAQLATEAKREWNEVIVRIKARWESQKLKHILEIQEQQFGKEDRDTLNTKIDLAAALQLQKDFTGAQKQLEEVFEALSRARSADLKPQLEEVSEALGRAGPTDLKDDPITRRAVDCFASLLGCLHEDKETVLKEVSKMQSQKLGEEHPLTVNSKADLAVLQERDEQKEAAQVLKEILREPHGHDVGIDFVKDLTLSPGPAAAAKDPEELVSHAGTTPHDLAKDGDDKKVFVALLSGKDCECLWLQDRTIRQLKEEAQQKLDLTIKNLIGPNMEPLDEEKMLAEENVMPGTTLTVVAVNQAAEDEKEAAECYNDIVRAAFCGQLGAVRHLLRTVPGAVAAKDDSGRTALHAAARDGHAEICLVLLAAKAEVDARDDYYGRTPLHWAVLNGRAEVVKLLLEAKASVTVKDDEGRTPLDDARENGYDEVVKILENAA